MQADLFDWEPEQTYDVCFFGFWLSHVPEERFATFWAKLRRALAPGGRVLFVDSSPEDVASAVDRKLSAAEDSTMLRSLADGREFRIVKRFHESQSLTRRLAELGWQAELSSTPKFFIHGQAQPA